ncbi:UbiD family decarboxylase [Bartonella sp. LJL80]
MSKTDQSMRGFLQQLEREGALHHVTYPVDIRYEIASILALRPREAAQFFDDVKQARMPVVGNIYNSRARFAQGLGIEPARLDAFCHAALRNPIPPIIVDNAPVQDVVIKPPFDIADIMPVPCWFEKEDGPYITAGIIIAKDPETGRRNVSIARLRLEGGQLMMAGIAKNHHLAQLADKAMAKGRSLEIAIVIGNHTALLLGSQLYLDLGDDEYDTAGALLGTAVELVKCKTVDLEVPAHSEIVLEGILKPDQLIDEGAVSEFPGFYVYYGPGIGVEATCITHRSDAIYQAILPGFAPEHCLLGGVAIGATLTRDLARTIPAVRRVIITEGGMGRLHAVIVMHKPKLGEGKRAVLLAMGMVNLLKLVTVVDDDIDPEDPMQVEWSLAARFRGHEDLIVLPGVKADRCDPVHEHLTVTKIGLVATTRPGDGADGGRSEFVRPPMDVFNRIRDTIDQY